MVKKSGRAGRRDGKAGKRENGADAAPLKILVDESLITPGGKQDDGDDNREPEDGLAEID
jgi:hypothetical protein